MTRKNRRKPPAAQRSPEPSTPAEIAKVIEEQSAEIAERLRALNGLPPRDARGRLSPKDEARAAELSAEIRGLSAQMNALREQTGHWHQKPPLPPERQKAEADKLQLRKELGRIADAQVTLVADWNSNPNESKKPAFEEEYRRLGKEYTEVLSELQNVREQIEKM